MQDIENSEYHAILGASSSVLNLLLNKTPAHVYAQYFAENRKQKEPTSAMKLGSAIHCAVLEPSEFEKRYFVTDADKRSKEGKAIHAEIESNWKQAIKTEDAQMLDEIVKSLSRTFTAKLLLSGGHAEKSIIVKSDLYGIDLKIRPDYFVMPCEQWPNGLIVDVKTTEDASPKGFTRSIFNYGYALQSAFYVDVFQRYAKSKNLPQFVWLVIEKESQQVAFYNAEDFIIEHGREKYQSVLPLLANCIKTGDWFGYDDCIKEPEFTTYQLRAMGVELDDVEVSYV